MKHVGTQPVETERLVLRRFTLEDAQKMYENWANDPEVSRWMRWAPHKSPDETRALLEDWVAGYQRPDYYSWAVQRKMDGELVGSIGIFYGLEEQGAAQGWEPGYCFGRAFWGQGYATEALRAVVDYFETNTGVDEMVCCHAKGNPASGRVMQKVGFEYLEDTVYRKLDGTVVPARLYKKERQG